MFLTTDILSLSSLSLCLKPHQLKFIEEDHFQCCESCSKKEKPEEKQMSRSSNNGGGGPCGACKFLRRKCEKSCVFAPYFDSEQGIAHFAAVHKVFGASNASKLLIHVPVHRRLDAVVTLCYEALTRVRDPVYGCVAHIFSLQQQVMNLQMELALVQARLYTIQRISPNFAPTIPRASSLDNVLSPSNIRMPLDPFETMSFLFSDRELMSSVDLNKIIDCGYLI